MRNAEFLEKKLEMLSDINLKIVIESAYEQMDDLLSKKQKFFVIMLLLLEDEKWRRKLERIKL